jgi:glycyl-tRNA synthetase beta chain
VNTNLLEPGAEADLYSRYEDISGQALITYLANRDYKPALLRIASIRPEVDAFFDKVLVNSKDEQVRANRLTLLNKLLTEFSTIADFSEIVTAGEQKQ